MDFQRFTHPDPAAIDIDVLFVDASTFEKLNGDSTPVGEQKKWSGFDH